MYTKTTNKHHIWNDETWKRIQRNKGLNYQIVELERKKMRKNK